MKRHTLQKTLLLLTAIVVLFVLFQQTATACPTCKNALAEGQENVAEGYFWSILFMMSMPFLIFGGLGLYFYLTIRRARARRAHQSEKTSAGPVATGYSEPATADEPAGELLEV